MRSNKRILFVDDEIRVLQGLQRILHGLRHEWDMEFVESGSKAVEMMNQQPFDVVVSDMRMPGMNGAELLEKVMQIYPQTIRIVLSGHSDREMILKSVRTAHQYLSKPCDAETLKSTVIRASKLRELLKGNDIKTLISKMDTLPSLPSLYVEMMDELQSAESSVKNVGHIIEKDIGMSAKILQLVNSAFFGLPRHISNPAQAVSLLGLETVKALVLSVQVFSQFQQSNLKNLSLNLLWKHSMTVGHFSRKIYQNESSDKNFVGYALIAGMLHDIGKLVLVTNFPEKYDSIILLASKHEKALPEIEQNELGTTHAEVGAYILGLWGLPDLIVEAIAYHHAPSQCTEKEFTPLVTVHAANVMEHEMFPNRRMGQPPAIDSDYLVQLGITNKLAVWQKICEGAHIKEIPDEQESTMC